jgi:hypothetical protein
MEELVKRLAKVYSELNYENRKAMRDFIDDFEKKEYSEKRDINESLKRSLGPLMSNVCPYCGK